MKKYLMTGIAAVAMCAAFTSCSKDTEFEPLTQEQLDQQKAEQITLAYNQAFVKNFGQPASNQTWGFGTTRAFTRAHENGAIDVNGNEWTYAPGVRIPEEVNAIYEYVKMGTEWMTANGKPFSTNHPENLNGYFVTQVRDGFNEDNAYPNIYTNDEVTDVGKWMNYLQIKFTENATLANLANASEGNGWQATGWAHINDFNGSLSADNANSESASKGNTKVVGKGAYDFAYYNSQDHQFHNKWILVDGADISSDPYYADFYYVCFDFESTPNAYNTTRYSYWKDGHGGWNGQLSGTYYTSEELIAKLTELGQIDSSMSQFEITGYEQGDKMIPGDNVYSDWIIRITKGKPDFDGRIMAEDLCAQEGSDFDFNDVVFDWKVIEDGDKAKIKLLAAGGTMPLRIGGTKDNENSGVEVHGKFGVNPGIMVNTATDDAPRVVVKSYQEFEILASEANLSAFAADGSNIPIYVKKDGVWVELTAYQGAPAAKFNCPVGTKWVDEYANIVSAYPDFANYVSQPGIEWWKNVVPRFVNLLISDNN